ncbi:MAG: hypothetical protein ACT4P3_19995 [Betaproteobacteria bacterium]
MSRMAVILALLASHAWGAPFAVQVGEARIALDAPPGFADSSFTGSPRLQELAESQTSPSNKILMFAISDGDLRRFMTGDTPEFRRYMLVVTPKASERERITPAAFQQLVDAAAREAAGAEAELRKERDVFSVQLRFKAPPARRGAEPQEFLSTRSLMLVHGKALDLTVLAEHHSPADLQWIRAVTTRWIDELQRLNAR